MSGTGNMFTSEVGGFRTPEGREGTAVTWDFYLHKDMVMNANDTYAHWSKKNDKAQDIKTFGKVHGRKLGKHVRVRIDVEVSYPINRQRDVNNLQPTMKHYIDGLVDRPDTVKGQKQGPARGILADDDDSRVTGPFMLPSGVRCGRKDHYLFRITMTDI